MHSEKIISIKKIGLLPSIDIEVDNKSHIFFANGGIATSNSHGVTYATDGYWSAYIKAHFPLAFYYSWIKNAKWKADTDDEVTELINDCKLHNIDVRVPQLYNITESTAIIDDDFIQFGASELKGIGIAFTREMESKFKICEEKCGKARKDWSFIDFLIFASKELGKTATEVFINVGVLDYMKDVPTRNGKMYQYQILQKLSSTGSEIDWLISQPKRFNNLKDYLTILAPTKKEGGGTSNKNRSNIIYSLITLLDNPTHGLEDSIEWIALQEQNYLGTPLTTNKVDACLDAVAANMTCLEFINYKNTSKFGKDLIILAVEVVSSKVTTTKSGKTPGQKMSKLKIRDNSLMIDAVCFPKQYAQIGHYLQEGATLLISGEKTKEGSFSINKVKEI